jgi:hypothetical protein
MKHSHLAKLFNGFGIILLVICLNTFIASQGEKPIFGIPLISDERAAMSFFGLIMGSVLLFLTCAAGFLFAHRTAGRWPAKIPPVWLQGLDPETAESKVYQVMVLIILVAVPTVCLIHFFAIVWHSKLCVLGDTTNPVMVSESWFGGIPGATNQIRLVEDLLPNGTCGNGIQVFPGWEFSLLWLAIAVSLLMTLFFLLEVANFLPLRRRTKNKRASPLRSMSKAEQDAAPR